MRAIERTTRQFVSSVQAAVPDAKLTIQRSIRPQGRSTYVYIDLGGPAWRSLKVRISDHPVGMRRALSGNEDLFLHHQAKPASWAVWVSQLPRRRRSS